MRYRQPFHASDTPPHRASDRDRSEENGQEYCESTRAHPIRQGDLGGRIKARDDEGPRSSRDELARRGTMGSRASPNRMSPNAAVSEARQVSSSALVTRRQPRRRRQRKACAQQKDRQQQYGRSGEAKRNEHRERRDHDYDGNLDCDENPS